MGETSRGDASFIEDVSLSWSGGLTLVESYLEEAPFEEFSDDVEIGSATPSIGLLDSICVEPLDSMPMSSSFLPITPSHLHTFHESLGDIRGSPPLFDPYCTYREDSPRKVMWTTFFDHAFDFSIAFDEFKRALTLFAIFLLVFSYLYHFEMHAKAHDKLLRALTVSELTARVLRDKEWLKLLAPLWHSSGTISTRPGIITLTLLPSFHFLSFSSYLVVDIRLCLVVDIRLCFCW